MLSEAQRTRIIRRHRDSLNRHGYSAQALYWSNREIQEIRFKVLSDIGIQSGDSLLDVGCGFADLKTWLEQHGIFIQYSGLDLSPDLLNIANQRHENVTFLNQDIMQVDLDNNTFDWLFLSGALNEVVDTTGEYAYAVITKMFSLCQKGIAFNLLSNRNPKMQHFPDLQSHNPQDILTFCKNLSKNCQCIEGYLDNDFTIYLYK